MIECGLRNLKAHAKPLEAGRHGPAQVKAAALTSANARSCSECGNARLVVARSGKTIEDTASYLLD